MSGSKRLIWLSASLPSQASPTTDRPGIKEINAAIRSRIAGESSAITTLSAGMAGSPMPLRYMDKSKHSKQDTLNVM